MATSNQAPPVTDILYRILEGISRVEGMLMQQKLPTQKAPVQDVQAFQTVTDPFNNFDFF